MKRKRMFWANNRGSLLMHTVVLSVLMAMMGTMMLKWATNRYEVMAKSRRQIKANSVAQSCLSQKMIGWSDNPPVPGSSNMDCTLEMDGSDVTMHFGTMPFGSTDGSFAIVISMTQDVL